MTTTQAILLTIYVLSVLITGHAYLQCRKEIEELDKAMRDKKIPLVPSSFIIFCPLINTIAAIDILLDKEMP